MVNNRYLIILLLAILILVVVYFLTKLYNNVEPFQDEDKAKVEYLTLTIGPSDGNTKEVDIPTVIELVDGAPGTNSRCLPKTKGQDKNNCIFHTDYCTRLHGQCGIPKNEFKEKCGEWEDCKGGVCRDYEIIDPKTKTVTEYCLARGNMTTDFKEGMTGYTKLDNYIIVGVKPKPADPEHPAVFYFHLDDERNKLTVERADTEEEGWTNDLQVELIAFKKKEGHVYNTRFIHIGKSNTTTIEKELGDIDIENKIYLPYSKVQHTDLGHTFTAVITDNGGDNATITITREDIVSGWDRDLIITEIEDITETTTESPTESPTISPTESPTEAPTESPTESPTVGPTEAPTVGPTEENALGSTTTFAPASFGPNNISNKLNNLSGQLNNLSNKFSEHNNNLSEHNNKLSKHNNKLSEHSDYTTFKFVTGSNTDQSGAIQSLIKGA